MNGPVWRYTDHVDAEARGRDRDDAIAQALAWMNRFAKGRKVPAEQRLEVRRVRRLGPGWWSVRFARRRA